MHIYVIFAYLLPNARENDNKGSEQSKEDDVKRDGGNIAGDGSPITVAIQCRPAIGSERIEPASHCRLTFRSRRYVQWPSSSPLPVHKIKVFFLENIACNHNQFSVYCHFI